MKTYIEWKEWAKAAGIRAVKTLAQTAVATIGTAVVLSASALAGVLSILTSIAGLPEVSRWEEVEDNDSEDV